MAASRILVTGATGFIGGHLVARLRRDGRLLTLAVRNRDACRRAWLEEDGIRIVETGAIESATNLDTAFSDVTSVAHLAGMALSTAGEDQEAALRGANVVATKRLVDAAVEHGIEKFIHLSSLFAVTDGVAADVIDDDTRNMPSSIYGRSKRQSEEFVRELPAKGVFAVSLRLPLVIGPDAKGNWAALQKLAATGVPLPFGSIRNRRSIISVDSSVDVIAHLLKHPCPVAASGNYFIADGAASTADMVTELRRGMGRTPRLVPVPPVLLSAAATLLGQQRRVSSLLGSCEVDDRRFRRTFGYRRPFDVGQAIRNAVPAGQPTQSKHRASNLKRVFDITLAAAALPFAAPVILTCVAAIKATSHGPGIFCQPRVGLNEQTFTCYKLRTMYSDTRDVPSHEASTSQVTPIGRWLRRLKFDELPQLWNILRGEMSFVGPRPCLPSQTALIAARRSRDLYAIRPGITGVSQVAGVDMSDPEKLAELDETYLDDMSIGTDLRLIVATAFGAGQGDRVRQ
jgi:lipopolysaccharide/colanic/teichoic acid biosynthesis glycosyltransferase/nucleoside-diphosphate-sugar epimerase